MLHITIVNKETDEILLDRDTDSVIGVANDPEKDTTAKFAYVTSVRGITLANNLWYLKKLYREVKKVLRRGTLL